MDSYPKLAVAIIGSGKIGTDLLLKVIRSPFLRCELFVGRNMESQGLTKARSLGITVSDRSIAALQESQTRLDLVFDATSAEHHKFHAEYLFKAGIKAIDLTPSKVGQLCVPALNSDVILHAPNINLVTCGGQASIPVVTTLAKTVAHIRHLEIHSLLAEDSVGLGTLANIAEYYSTTAAAITEYSGVRSVEVDLQVEPSRWKPDMLTRIRAHVEGEVHMDKLYDALTACLTVVRAYVPGYSIVGTPRYENGVIEILVSVRGAGDWIPSHAGNLDIINCAAIAAAERFARMKLVRLDNSPKGNTAVVGRVLVPVPNLQQA